MKKIITSLGLLLLYYLSPAQLNSWSFESPSGFSSLPFEQRNGCILETDHSIYFLVRNTITELSHYGEFIGRTQLFTVGLTSASDFFFMDELHQGDSTYFLVANWEANNGNIYLSTYYAQGDPILRNYDLSDVINAESAIGPVGLGIGNGEYLFFGAEWISLVKVIDPHSIEFMGRVPNYDGLINAAKATCNGYISCSVNGIVNYINPDLSTEWSLDLAYDTRTIAVTGSAYYIAGNFNNKGRVTKINLEGDIVWQKTYNRMDINHISALSNGDILLFGGDQYAASAFFENDTRLARINKDGEVLQEFKNDILVGTYSLESQYGGVFMMLRGYNVNHFLYLREIDDYDKDIAEVSLNPSLDVNNIKTEMLANGRYLSGSNSGTGYFFPKGAATRTIRSADLWLSAINEAEEIVYANKLFSIPSYSLFTEGPVGSFASRVFWDRVFHIDQDEIDAFRKDWSDGAIDRPIPFNILQWPAMGNPNARCHGKKVKIEKEMAPFVDTNHDGIYNALDGDYPKIKGDEMLWSIMNDSIDSPYFSSIGVEVQSSLYAFSCEDELLNNATFLELKIENISESPVSNFNCGLFTDFELGCNFDDFYGFLPESNSYYAYNAYEEDGEICNDNDAQYFTDDIPIQSITFLNQQMSKAIFFSSAPQFDNAPYGEHPHNEEIYDYMNGIWPDGTPLRYGGFGFLNPGAPLTDIPFDGNPAVSSEWSMCNASISPENMQFLVSNSKPSLTPGESQSYHFGFLTHQGIDDLPCPDIDQIKPRLQALQDLYDDYLSDEGYQHYHLNLGPDQYIDESEILTLDAGPGASSYLWSTGETSQTVTVHQTGTYSVSTNSTFACQQTDTIHIYNEAASIAISPEKLHLFPNPSLGHLCVVLEDHIPENMELYDMMGRKVRTIITDDYTPNSVITFELGELPAGMYLLSCQYGKDQRVVQRVVLK